MPKGGKGNNGNGNGGVIDNQPVTSGSDGDDIINAENKINGGDGNDIITASDGADRVNAGDGDDRVAGGAGDDTLYGNDGWDTAVFSGDIRDYSFSDGKGNAFIVDGADGTDTLKHFEELEFDNFTIYLDGRNNTQLVEDHAMIVSEDSDGTIDLLAGAWDFEGDTLTVTGASGGTLNGSDFSFDASGNYDHLAVGESTTKEFTFSVTDGTNVTTNTVTVTIEGENDATVTANDSGSADEDSAGIGGNVLINDFDVDASDVLSVANAGNFELTYGTLTVDSEGGWSFTPNEAAQGLDDGDSVSESVTLDISDGHGIVNSELSITVTGSNDAPIVTDDSGSTDEDSAGISGNLLANDSDVDANDALSVANAGNFTMTYGALSVATDGSWSFTPNAIAQSLAVGESHSESVSIDVSDGTETVSQSITITVTGNNDAPEANNDSTYGDEDAGPITGNVLANDSDIDASDMLSVSNTGTHALTSGASVTLEANGDYSYQQNGAFDSLALGETATDTFSYTIDDGNGGTDTAEVTVTINGTNDDPTMDTASSDSSGSVTAIATEFQEPSPLVFTVEQYTGYQSNNLTSLMNYAANNVANYTAETNVIDFTDDPNGFGGELEGSSPWPAAQATGASGTGGINNIFFARITTEFSVSTGDTFTFRTYNDDGVFLMVDGELIINDPGYHGETAFEGSIYLEPGNHTIELYFFEYGGEASLELSVKDSTGEYGLVGGTDGLLGGSAEMLTDDGTISFADVDLSDTHSVTASPADSGYLGSFEASLSDAATGGSTGEIAWTFSVNNEDVVYLGAGESLTQTYQVTVMDNNGASVSENVTVTLSGTNESPTITGGDITGTVTEAVNNSADENNNATHNASGTVSFDDVDVTDTHTVSSAANGNAYLGSFIVNVSAAGVVSWSFNVSDADLDFLEENESVTQTYDVTVDDGNGGTATETVTVTINGALDNTAPVAVDDIFAPNSLLQDTSFETPTTASHTGNPTGSAWTFTGNTGVTTYAPTNNEFSFTGGGASGAPDGNQVAFLQYWSGATSETMISQTITAYAGEYTLEFDAAARANYGQNVAAFEVRIDGVTVATIEETSTDYVHHSITFDIPTNGEHIISLVAVPSSNSDGDDTILLDNIELRVISTDFSDTVATNDSDLDVGDVLIYTLDTPVAGLTMNSDGSYVVEQSHPAYTLLGEGETLDVVANYTVTDAEGATDQATLTFTVTGLDDPITIVEGAGGTADAAAAGANAANSSARVNGAAGQSGSNGEDTSIDYSNVTHETANGDDTVTLHSDNHGEDGGAGGSGGSSANTGAYYSYYSYGWSYYYFYNAGHGGDGGNGGNAGSTLSTLLDTTTTVFAGDDEVTLTASALGSDGGNGGTGGDGGSAGSTYWGYSGWGYYYQYWGGKHGDGGDGGDGGNGGYAQVDITGNEVFGDKNDDTILLEATAEGGDGGNGATSGRSSGGWYDSNNGTSGDGGDGGDAGSARVDVKDNSVEGGDGADHITISATATAGTAGSGGNSANKYYYSYGAHWGNLGSNGDAGDGGSASVSVENNVLDGNNGNDILELIVDSIATTGTSTAYINNNTLSGGAGDDTFLVTIDSSGSSIDVQMSGNTFDGGSGNDVFIFDVESMSDHIDGGDDYDILDLNMGVAADYNLTENNDGSWSLEYNGEISILTGIEEIQFTDSTYFF